MKNVFAQSLIATTAFILSSSSVFAHVVVKPSNTSIGIYQTFTMGVPVEKDVPTTALRLVIPEQIESVTPNVKPGWTITVKKAGEGEDAKVTEIEWKGGTIPAGQRDEFLFSAKVPVTETTLVWKAYQTYKDGTVVAWDHEPSVSAAHGEGHTPYSTTKVIDDLSAKPETKIDADVGKAESPKSNGLAVVALALSVVSLVVAAKKNA